MAAAQVSHAASHPPARRARRGHVIGQALALIALGLLAGAADSWIRPVRLSASEPAGPRTPALTPEPAPGPAPQEAPPTTAPSPESTPPAAEQPLGLHIDLAQARVLFEKGIPFLDARTEEEFRAGHIAGAFHLPSDAFTRGGKVEALQYLDQNEPVVIYCGGGDCHASEYVAIELEKAGFKAYHIMKDGFPSWRAAGYDVAEGDQ